jgi:hypothetical protein
MKKGLTVLIFMVCFTVLFSATRSFASGDLFGAHCWTGDVSGIFIKLQFTRNGPLRVYNVNGTVLPSGRTNNPAYGTAFYDDTVDKVKVGYTVVVPRAFTPVNTVYLELNPDTLNGTKVVFPAGSTEGVGLVSCKVD